MKVITVSNRKGGVGKTTIVFNLAKYLSKTARVGLVDLDPQGNLSNRFIKDPLCYASSLFTDIPKANFYRAQSNISIITSNDKLGETINEKKIKYGAIEYALNKRKKDFDYIIIDCPPAIAPLNTSALIASDYVLLITLLSKDSIEGAVKVISQVEALNYNSGKHIKILGIIVNQLDRYRIQKHYLNELEEKNKDILFKNYLPNSTMIHNALDNNMAVWEFNKNNKASQIYKNLLKEIKRRIK